MADWYWIVIIINVIFAVYIVFFERRRPTAALAWLLILFLLPVAGFILYVFFGRSYYGKEESRFREGQFLLFAKEIQDQIEEIVQGRFTLGSAVLDRYLSMVYLLLRSDNSILTLNNQVKTYADGPHAFPEMMEDIRQAHQHI
ncbi:MAG TPA: PLDc N-terminal domain-containing protein, partial [Methanomicrobiales archaeon]|nr:PLDc N-terminal domain-containing protein [Methanomicrobiales archaeon]